jgi:hypothetical protein
MRPFTTTAVVLIAALCPALALPVNRYHSVTLYGITGYNAYRDHDFQAVGIAWPYRWGGGY